MDWLRCEVVESIPGKVGGVPLIRGSRVPVDQILGSHDAGESADEIADNYDLHPADVRAVLAYRSAHQPALRR